MKHAMVSLVLLSGAALLQAAPGDLVWSYETGDRIESSPAVSGGYVYVGSYDGKVYCLDASTGALAWSYATGYTVCSSPALCGGYLYMGTNDGRLYCLDAASGALVWLHWKAGPLWSSPAVSGDHLYVGGSQAYCFDAATGEQVECYHTGDIVISSPALRDGYVYFGSMDNNVYCYHAASGALVWSYATGDEVHSSPAVSGGHVYVGSLDGNVYCLDAATGALVWTYETGWYVFSSPAVDGRYVYVGTGDRNVYCLDAATGGLVWSHAMGCDVSSSPAVSGGYVYVGGLDHKVYCLDASTGALAWSYETGDSICHSSPAAEGGSVYLASYDNNIYCLEAGAGDPGEWPMFRHDLAHTGEHTPVVLNGGWNLIGCGTAAPTPLADCCVTDGIDSRSYDAAVAAGWLQTMLYYYSFGYLECRTDGAGDDDHLRPQYGYWLLAYRPGLRLSPWCAATEVSPHEAPSEVALLHGWNLIGSGLTYSRPLSWYQLTDGLDTKTYDEAVAAGWVATVVYYYDGGYFVCRTDGAGDDEYLRPWYGYWLLTYRSGLSLLVPTP